MTAPEAARLVGFSHSTANRRWQRYKREGFSTLQAGVQWMQENFAVTYTVGGLWKLFQRLGYKLKTGRPQHHKQDLEAQADFKKKFIAEADLLKLPRLFSDEMRFGLHIAHKRQWMP
jgi:transposase